MSTFTEQQIWLVWSNEHNAWWKPNACGYTTTQEAAGRYTWAEAHRHAAKRSPSDTGLPDELVVPAPECAALYSASPKLLSLLERVEKMFKEAGHGSHEDDGNDCWECGVVREIRALRGEPGKEQP